MSSILAQKLRSHTPCSAAKKIKKKKEYWQNLSFPKKCIKLWPKALSEGLAYQQGNGMLLAGKE